MPDAYQRRDIRYATHQIRRKLILLIRIPIHRLQISIRLSISSTAIPETKPIQTQKQRLELSSNVVPKQMQNKIRQSLSIRQTRSTTRRNSLTTPIPNLH